MTLKYQFVKRNIADDFFLVPIGEAAVKFNGIIMLNEISSYIFDLLPDCDTADEIAAGLVEKYDVEYEKVKDDVEAFLNQLRENEIID